MKRNSKTTLLIVISLLLVFVGIFAMAACSAAETQKTVVSYIKVSESENKSDSSSLTEGSIPAVVAKVADSVVEITTETAQNNPFMQDYVTEGAGSGVIISLTEDQSTAYVVTNHHVIEGADTITVTLRNGTVFAGTLVGTDAKSDLAIVQITPDGVQLTQATFGQSSSLLVGQTAIAIGNPLRSLGGTVTSGIISALDRQITVDGNKMRLLQTTAAINPGNSGGGLFNLNGELIGIVNAKSSGTGIEGLGFAIPSDYALEIVPDLIEKGYIAGRPGLGLTLGFRSVSIGFQTITLPKVVAISNQSAIDAGLQENDIIFKIDGTTYTSADSLRGYLLSAYSAGDQCTLTVLRTENNQTVQIEIPVTLIDAHDVK